MYNEEEIISNLTKKRKEKIDMRIKKFDVDTSTGVNYDTTYINVDQIVTFESFGNRRTKIHLTNGETRVVMGTTEDVLAKIEES